MNSKQIKGLPVISIEEGMKVGSVDRVYLDPESRQVVGVSITGGGLLSGQPGLLIDCDEIRSLGPDVLTITDAQVEGAHLNECYARLISLDALTGRQVMTKGGTFAGRIESVDFDERTFQLAFIATSLGFFGPRRVIPAGQVETIGQDVVVVANETVPTALTTEPEPTRWTARA